MQTQVEIAAWQAANARRDLPRFDALARDLSSLAQTMFTPAIAYQHLNSADLMALTFGTKHREHMQSVRTLIAADLHRDALLIARTMLEARGRLLWAFRQVPLRTDLWLWFGVILDWRQLAKNRRDGVFVDAADEALLQQLVKQHGPAYVRADVRKRMAEVERDSTAYRVPADPWEKNDWTTTSVRDMFKELGEERLYISFYRRTSEWVHSGPRSVLIAADEPDLDNPAWSANQFTENDVVSGAWALGVACESLLRSLEVVNDHFMLGYDEHLGRVSTQLNDLVADSAEPSS